MNPPSEVRFPRLPFAKAEASPGTRLLRAKGPAPSQPRATPWVTRCKDHPSSEGATQPVRQRPMSRPYRAKDHGFLKPKAMPWAAICRTVGAKNPPLPPSAPTTANISALERQIDQQVYALYGMTPEEIAIVEGTAP